MTGFIPPRRARILVGLSLLLSSLYLGLSLRQIGGGNVRSVLDSPLLPLTPRLLEPGWHFIPLGFVRLTRYPDGPSRISFHLPRPGSRRLASAEGVGVEVVGELSYRIPDEALLEVHYRFRGDPEKQFVRKVLEGAILDSVRETSFTRISGAHRYELEGTVSLRVGRVLREAGVRFQSIRVDAVRMAGGSLGGVTIAPIPGARLLIVGWDGADWRIIDPLLAMGRMPNLARLIHGGVRTRLKSVAPILSPVVWTTAATGFLPPEHGILDFLVTDTRTGEKIPVTSRQRKVRAIWNLLGDAGVPVGVIGWWASWPAEQVEGYLVSDRIAYQLLGQGRIDDSDPRGKTFPPDLFRKIHPLIVPPQTVTDSELARFVRLETGAPESWSTRSETRLDEFRTVLASTRTYEGIALALGSGGFQPFQAIYFEGIDTTSHLFMPFRPPRRSQVPEVDYRRFSQAVDSFYVYQDEILGRLLEKAGPGTSVMILSDHGFRSGADRPLRESRIAYATAALWHRRYGILVAHGEPFAKGLTLPEASILDITPTVLALFGLPVGEDMQGRPIETLFTTEFLRKHPTRYRPSWETTRKGRVTEVSDPDGDRALREKLLSLGYLSQEGTLPHNNLGNALLARGNVEGAIREFRKALEAAPRFDLPRINLARAYLRRGDLGPARRELEEVLKISPDAPGAQVLLANIEREAGDVERAESRIRTVLQQDPSDTEAIKSLGLTYQRRGDRSRARSEYARAAEIDPDDPEAYNNLGVLLKEEGKLEEAESQLRRAIDADPDFAGSYNNLALVAMDREDYETAERYLRQAIEKSPDDPLIHNNLGNVLFRRGDLDRAERAYRKALSLRPEYPEPHNGLGAIFGKRGDGEGEIAEYRRALDLDSRYADARLNLALALSREGRREEAEAEFRRVLEARPGDPAALGSYSRFLLVSGRGQAALEICRKATRTRPERADLWNLLGEAALATGDRGTAAEAFRTSLARKPDQPGVVRSLAELERSRP